MVDADAARGTKGDAHDAREEGVLGADARAVFDLDSAADSVADGAADDAGRRIRIFSYEMSADVTWRYEDLVELFIRNGLEFSVDEEIPTDIVKCWDAVDPHAERLIGGCVLARREGAFIIDGIAAEPEYRAHKLGKRLLAFAADEAKARGGRELFLVARAPGFFRKQGFVTVPREGAPTFFECFTCPQYNKSCFPEVMRLTW